MDDVQPLAEVVGKQLLMGNMAGEMTREGEGEGNVDRRVVLINNQGWKGAVKGTLDAAKGAATTTAQ